MEDYEKKVESKIFGEPDSFEPSLREQLEHTAKALKGTGHGNAAELALEYLAAYKREIEYLRHYSNRDILAQVEDAMEQGTLDT